MFFAVIHEGLHALPAATFGELKSFQIKLYGLEVIFKTPVKDREGVKWFVISGLPNIVTITLGYLMLSIRQRIRIIRNHAIRDFGYFITLLFLVIDPSNLSIGPIIYGGDALGVAEGLDISVVIIQVISFIILIINRELVAQILLPTFEVTTSHPLFKPSIRFRARSR